MEPFRFLTATQAAHQAPTAQKALDYALSPTHAHQTQARLLAGVAQREDLTPTVAKKILKHLPDRASTVLRNLLLNPLVNADENLGDAVVNYMSKDDIFLLATMPGARRYLPRMLAKCYEYGNDDVHLKWLLTVFTPTEIEQAVHTLIDEWEHALTPASPQARRPAGNTLALRVLGPTHMERLVTIVGHAVSNAATPLPSGRARHRDDAYEARINQMSLAEDVIAHLLVRDDLSAAQTLALVKHAEKVVSDAAAHTPTRHRGWARARATGHMLGRAKITPEAAAYAFTSDLFHISQTDLVLTTTDVEAALRATADHPRPLLVQRALTFSVTYAEDVVAVLLDAVRELEALRTAELSAPPATTTDDDVDATWGTRDAVWWGDTTRGSRVEDDIAQGLVRAAIDHIGTPVWDEVYAFVLAQPNQGASAHAVAVDYFAATAQRVSMDWSDDSATPVMEKFAEWASTSNDPHLRRHAVAQCWSHEQLATVAADPSPLVRIEVLAHDMATADDVLIAASDPDPTVRLAAAKHALLDERAIARLASDTDSSVRREVALRVMASLTA